MKFFLYNTTKESALSFSSFSLSFTSPPVSVFPSFQCSINLKRKKKVKESKLSNNTYTFSLIMYTYTVFQSLGYAKNAV